MGNGVFSKYMVSGSFILFLCLLVYGCTVKTYSQPRDRVDQEISGVKPCEQPRKTRKTYTLEIQPKTLSAAIPSQDMTQLPGKLPQKIESTKAPQIKTETAGAAAPVAGSAATSFVFPLQRTVAQGETLQAISLKYYNTNRKWPKIFEANAGRMKTPDHVEAGMVLTIPQP